jgi:hypothetical protein
MAWVMKKNLGRLDTPAAKQEAVCVSTRIIVVAVLQKFKAGSGHQYTGEELEKAFPCVSTRKAGGGNTNA